MALTLVATPGAVNANSYLTLAEAVAYYETRSTVQEWEDADSQEALLIMATRTIDAVLSGRRVRITGADGVVSYIVGPMWTGAPASETQALAWPRTGMYNRNGVAIASTVIPQELKDAVAELAGQLAKEDRTLDNAIAVQGITSVKAGSVAVSFGDNATIATSKMLSDMVWFLLPSSWFTEEYVEGGGIFDFEVMG